MVTSDDAIVVISEALRRYAGDQRMKNLFIWGAHTDCRAEPCECCGTPLIVLETSNSDQFPATSRRPMELVSSSGPNIPDMVFRQHTPDRCRSRRGHYDTHRS